MSSQFENKVVAITGAGKGLGRAYALYFGQMGASVVVNNRRHDGEEESSADRVVAEIARAGGKAVAEYNSVEDVEAGDSILSVALENFGHLDCLIANAGVMESGMFRNQSMPELHKVIDINLIGTINVAHPVFRHMCDRQSGNIIVTTSSAGLFGQIGLPAYSTAKAAVIGLMRSLSQEGASKGVNVNAIAPYATTQMTIDHLSDEIGARLDPEQVAPAVAWLASGTVTGEILIAGGGYVARARMKTGDPAPGPGTGPGAGGFDWQELKLSALDRQFDSGRHNFEDFAANLDAADGE